MRTTYPRNVVSRNRYSTHPIAFGILLAMYHRMRRGVKAATLVRYTMALGLIVSFWFVRSANVDLRARWTRQIVETSRPAVLNGLEVRLDRHLEPAVRTTGGRGRYLVLISSDQCPYSLAEVDRWRELLARVPFGPDDTVIHMSVSGTGVAGELADMEHVPFQFLQFTDYAAFAQETGLAWTPGVAVLDARFRLRLASSRVTPTVAKHVANFFGNNVEVPGGSGK